MPFKRDRLKGRRIDMGITLQEVADTIGVEKPTVQRYESGKINKIDTITVEKLASAIKCSPAYLMGWQEAPLIEQVNNCNLSAHEKNVVFAYRKSPDMRPAVDRILGISAEQDAQSDNKKPNLSDFEQISKEAQAIKQIMDSTISLKK